MAPFESMSALEKEELVISLAALICADAKVEPTVVLLEVVIMSRRKIWTSW